MHRNELCLTLIFCPFLYFQKLLSTCWVKCRQFGQYFSHYHSSSLQRERKPIWSTWCLSGYWTSIFFTLNGCKSISTRVFSIISSSCKPAYMLVISCKTQSLTIMWVACCRSVLFSCGRLCITLFVSHQTWRKEMKMLKQMKRKC